LIANKMLAFRTKTYTPPTKHSDSLQDFGKIFITYS
jgi:hypothetical protein